MFIATEQRDKKLIIRVTGVVGSSAAESLLSKLNEITSRRPSEVVMDFSNVMAIGLDGIYSIIMFFRAVRENDALFEVAGISENLFTFFKLLKLDELFPNTQSTTRIIFP